MTYYHKFNTVGIICDQHKRHSGRKQTGRPLENTEIVKNSVAQSPPNQCVGFLDKLLFPQRWDRCLSLRPDINAFPYKIETETELTELQKAKRLPLPPFTGVAQAVLRHNFCNRLISARGKVKRPLY